MDCRITSISRRGAAAFTLVEIMVAMAIGLMLVAAVLLLSYYSNRGFAALANYTDMDIGSQQGMDKMSKVIRQCRQLTAYTTNSVSFLDVNGNALQFVYDSNALTLSGVSASQTNVYLTGVDALQFSIYQRTPISGTFDCYNPASVTNAKLVEVTWLCSRSLLGGSNTESVQSAKIVMRNSN